MNILIISKNYYPSTIPDSKRFTGISEFLARQGHIVTVITETEDAISKCNNVRIIKTQKKGEDSRGMKDRFLNHFSYMFQSMKEGKDLSNIDVIIATSPPLFNLISGMYIKKKTKAKLVVDLRDIWPEVFEQTGVMTSRNPVYLIFKKIAKRSYYKADAIAVVTKGKAALISNKYPQYKEKLYYLSNGFNKNITEYPDLPELNAQFSGTFNVIYTGKIGMAQDIISFIDLAALHSNNETIKFHIMGSGKGVTEMNEYIDELGLDNIIYYGYKTEHEVIAALKNSQVSYVSLVNKDLVDSVPTKIYESLVSGCPVLISAVGESVDLVLENEFGCASEPGDFQQLCANFEYMFNNYELYKNNRNAVREEMMSKYSRDVVAESYESVLKKVTE